MGLPGIGAADAILQIKTETGEFLVLGMTGHEHLGQLFEYTIELAAEPEGGLLGIPNPFGPPPKSLIQKLAGTRATLTMDAKDDPRYFDGYVTRMKKGEKHGRYETYTMTLQPWLWFLTRTKTSRIFQAKSVKDIVTAVFADYGGKSDWRLDSMSAYPELDYCVQHNETDFDFVSRLFEEVGIYYFFEHEKSNHTLVLTDAMGKHKSRKGDAKIKWANAMMTSSTITDWHVQEEVRSIKTVLSDYDYLAPATKIEGEKSVDQPPEKLGPMEWFEHPAHVVQNSAKPDAKSAASAAKQRASVRMEELVALHTSATGTTNVRDLGTGMTFELDNAEADNGKYLVVSAVYRLDFANMEAGEEFKDGRPREGYRCDFLAISKDAPTYRSPRHTPRPIIAGPQTAVVVGTSGNEIETDKHGRIKIQFLWDRAGKKDQNSSCWVRVAQPWAGKGFGMFSLPRVGQEVVVHFLDGDPDRPLVTGSVYNNENMVAWTMPDHSTVGGVKSRSSKGGDAATANELRFEDKKGTEYVWFQAEKDFYRVVKNDVFDWIGHNETVKVELTRNEVIGENWFMDIKSDVMHHVGKDLHVNVDGDIFFTGAATWQMKVTKDASAKVGGDLGIDVGGKTQLKSMADVVVQSSTGKLSLKADVGDLMAEGMTIKIKGATTVAIEGGISVSLKAGPSFVNVGPSGVDIVGPLVKVNSGGSAGAAGSALKASPAEPTEAKKEAKLEPTQKTVYDENFKDPMKAGAPA